MRVIVAKLQVFLRLGLRLRIWLVAIFNICDCRVLRVMQLLL